MKAEQRDPVMGDYITWDSDGRVKYVTSLLVRGRRIALYGIGACAVSNDGKVEIDPIIPALSPLLRLIESSPSVDAFRWQKESGWALALEGYSAAPTVPPQDSARPAQTAEKREAICKICERRIILSGTFWCHNEPLSAEESQTIPLHEATPAAAPPPHPATQGGDVVDAARKLVAALDTCQPFIDGAFAFVAIHGSNYDGPTYSKELDALRALLGPSTELRGEGK